MLHFIRYVPSIIVLVFYNKQSLSSCTVLGIDQYYFGTAGYQIMQGREIIQEDSEKKASGGSYR